MQPIRPYGVYGSADNMERQVNRPRGITGIPGMSVVRRPSFTYGPADNMERQIQGRNWTPNEIGSYAVPTFPAFPRPPAAPPTIPFAYDPMAIANWKLEGAGADRLEADARAARDAANKSAKLQYDEQLRRMDEDRPDVYRDLLAQIAASNQLFSGARLRKERQFRTNDVRTRADMLAAITSQMASNDAQLEAILRESGNARARSRAAMELEALARAQGIIP
jgi:hypothetical protein